MVKKTKSRLISWILIGCALLLAVTLVCVATLWISFRNPKSIFADLPSDNQLIQNFRQHQDEFNQLATLLVSEKNILIISPDSNDCQSVNRKSILAANDPICLRYVNMFKGLGLAWSYVGHDPLWLNVSSTGLSVSGSTKGYYYSSQGSPANTTIVENTETSNASGQFIFRHIEGNWYIFVIN